MGCRSFHPLQPALIFCSGGLDRRINSSEAIISEFQIKDFSQEWPFSPVRHQSGRYRILTNVIPFLRVRLLTAQNVIKEPFLPMTKVTYAHFFSRALDCSPIDKSGERRLSNECSNGPKKLNECKIAGQKAAAVEANSDKLIARAVSAGAGQLSGDRALRTEG